MTHFFIIHGTPEHRDSSGKENMGGKVEFFKHLFETFA